MKEIGNKISFYRKERKMSQEELGKRLDVTKSYISKMENGKTPISLETLQNVADIFNIHIRDFFDIENVEDIEDVEELEPGVRIGFDKTKKDGLTEEDKQKALKFVKDLKEGKISILNITEKLNDIDI